MSQYFPSPPSSPEGNAFLPDSPEAEKTVEKKKADPVNAPDHHLIALRLIRTGPAHSSPGHMLLDYKNAALHYKREANRLAEMLVNKVACEGCLHDCCDQESHMGINGCLSLIPSTSSQDFGDF
jgi:hypothetical protein